MMEPKVCTIVQARTRSARFPNKVLKEIDGKPLLQILLERLRLSKCAGKIVVATTGAPQDDPVARLAACQKVDVFRGSAQDVLSRYYFAAKQHRAEIIVRITGDSPLMDPAVVDQIIDFYLQNRTHYDFVANTAPPPGTFPEGMDVEVFSFEALERAWRETKSLPEREHVTFYFWKNPKLFRTYQFKAEQDWSSIRIVVDYEDDFECVARMYRTFQEQGKFGSLKEIVDYARLHVGLPKHSFGEGWEASYKKETALNQDTPQKAAPLDLSQGSAFWEKVIKRIPGGAQTFSKQPAQFVREVAPKLVYRGAGSRVWDLDGNEFIDYTLGLGPAILGHGHSEVNEAAFECAKNYFNAPPMAHPLELELAEKIASLIPCAERVRFGKNGSDATAGAVRLARAYTGREIIACAGYHGWQDWYIGSTSRHEGVPDAVRRLTVPFQYNHIETLEQIFRDHEGNVAGVILEPLTFLLPEKDFLAAVRDLCDRHGAVLIFDEIITGFRLHLGGAQSYLGIIPDLATFGKAIANGYPLSVLCGSTSIMDRLNDVFFSFTFGGELPSIAAALKTIEILERDNALEQIQRRGAELIASYNRIAAELEMADSTFADGLPFWPRYQFRPTGDYRADEMLTLMQQELVKRGVLTRSAMFLSAAHTGYDLHETLNAMRKALLVVREGLRTGQLRNFLEGSILEPVIRSS